MKIMPVFFGRRLASGEGGCQQMISDLFQDMIIDTLPRIVPSGSLLRAKSLLESNGLKMSEEAMKSAVKDIVKEVSKDLFLCALEVKQRDVVDLITHTAEMIVGELEVVCSEQKKKNDYDDYKGQRNEEVKGSSSASASVQWFESCGFNDKIVIACREIGIDSFEDLHAVFADDDLYQQLGSMLRPLDQSKVEAVRQKLLS